MILDFEARLKKYYINSLAGIFSQFFFNAKFLVGLSNIILERLQEIYLNVQLMNLHVHRLFAENPRGHFLRKSQKVEIY